MQNFPPVESNLTVDTDTQREVDSRCYRQIEDCLSSGERTALWLNNCTARNFPPAPPPPRQFRDQFSVWISIFHRCCWDAGGVVWKKNEIVTLCAEILFIFPLAAIPVTYLR